MVCQGGFSPTNILRRRAKIFAGRLASPRVLTGPRRSLSNPPRCYKMIVAQRWGGVSPTIFCCSKKNRRPPFSPMPLHGTRKRFRILTCRCSAPTLPEHQRKNSHRASFYRVRRGGFEPPESLRRWIYSPLQLTALPPTRLPIVASFFVKNKAGHHWCPAPTAQ